ncbi:MAG: hypothetical protein ACFCD0_06860 [Gemmataceae bacterium]
MEEGFKNLIKLDAVKQEIHKMTATGVIKVIGTGVTFTAGSRARGAAVGALFRNSKTQTTPQKAAERTFVDRRTLFGRPCYHGAGSVLTASPALIEFEPAFSLMGQVPNRSRDNLQVAINTTSAF